MDDVEVRDRVHPVLDVHHIWVLKPSTDVHYAIHLLDVRQEGITQALSLRCAPASGAVS